MKNKYSLRRASLLVEAPAGAIWDREASTGVVQEGMLSRSSLLTPTPAHTMLSCYAGVFASQVGTRGDE
jgi:hypothetical protein